MQWQYVAAVQEFAKSLNAATVADLQQCVHNASCKLHSHICGKVQYLQVSMYNPPVVAVLDCRQDLPELAAGSTLRHPAVPSDVVCKYIDIHIYTHPVTKLLNKNMFQ